MANQSFGSVYVRPLREALPSFTAERNPFTSMSGHVCDASGSPQTSGDGSASAARYASLRNTRETDAYPGLASKINEWKCRRPEQRSIDLVARVQHPGECRTIPSHHFAPEKRSGRTICKSGHVRPQR